jgi:hypothetical protein
MKKTFFLVVVIITSITIFAFNIKSDVNSNQSKDISLAVVSETPTKEFPDIRLNNESLTPKERKKNNLLNSSESETEVESDSLDKEIYDNAKFITKKSQLQDLEEVTFLDEDKEVRVWIIEPNIPLKGFISTFAGGKWTAFDIIKTDNSKNIEKRFFDEPASGWKAWEVFFETELTPSSIKNAGRYETSSNHGVIVIETKSGSLYEKNIFSQSKSNQKDLDKIFSKIKSEFYTKNIKWGKF